MTAPSLLNRALAKSIRGYQKYLSPHKGFRCAHAVHHGGLSCSEYVRQSLLNQTLWQAVALSQQRFSECRTAAELLRATSTSVCCCECDGCFCGYGFSPTCCL